MPYITSIEQMGIERGKEEERQSIALNLLKQNVPLEMIVQATGLSIAQLQTLQTENQ